MVSADSIQIYASLPELKVTLSLRREHQGAGWAHLAPLTTEGTADGASCRGRGQGAAAGSGQELSSKYWTPELGGPAEKVTEGRETLVEDLGKEEENVLGTEGNSFDGR